MRNLFIGRGFHFCRQGFYINYATLDALLAAQMKAYEGFKRAGHPKLGFRRLFFLGICSSEVAEAGHHDRSRRIYFLGGEHVPETEGFVSSASDQGLAVGAGRQVEHSVRVTGERGDFLHGGVAPDIYLVLTVPVGGHQLVYVFRKHQIAHLRARID